MKIFILITTLFLSTSCKQTRQKSETQKSPDHYTVQNDSQDMILHIESQSKSISLKPGECAALTPEEIIRMTLKESDNTLTWYLLTLDFIYYNTLCTDKTSDSKMAVGVVCPKDKTNYKYLENNLMIIPTEEQAKNCKPLK